ncbi:hypothetical protein BN946_scf184705.g12 [Trametes cinnabarina]|uniref:Reverse transcriptase Ty1/copia-type domain-containing protein n=1 Tax=Pycnoporus cinnabarinus TaxID=5643 RepID=A0A060SRL0_PYCCI|nr:hypothetical protein BN946_scf184705.g12 [Trametes cinnabarina]
MKPTTHPKSVTTTELVNQRSRLILLAISACTSARVRRFKTQLRRKGLASCVKHKIGRKRPRDSTKAFDVCLHSQSPRLAIHNGHPHALNRTALRTEDDAIYPGDVARMPQSGPSTSRNNSVSHNALASLVGEYPGTSSSEDDGDDASVLAVRKRQPARKSLVTVTHTSKPEGDPAQSVHHDSELPSRSFPPLALEGDPNPSENEGCFKADYMMLDLDHDSPAPMEWEEDLMNANYEVAPVGGPLNDGLGYNTHEDEEPVHDNDGTDAVWEYAEQDDEEIAEEDQAPSRKKRKRDDIWNRIQSFREAREQPAEPQAGRSAKRHQASGEKSIGHHRQYAITMFAQRKTPDIRVRRLTERDIEAIDTTTPQKTPRQRHRAPADVPEEDSRSSTNIPDILKPVMYTKVIPTILDYFGSRQDPWGICEQGGQNATDLLELCQEVIDEIRQRIYDWRGNFANAAVVAIGDAISARFGSRPSRSAVQAWVKEATSDGGEAFWAQPHTNPAMAHGKMQSPFILRSFATHLTATEGSVRDYGYPGGALALATTAVQHCFPMFSKGSFEPGKAFNVANVGALTESWYHKVHRAFVVKPEKFDALIRSASRHAPAVRPRRNQAGIPEAPDVFDRSSPPIEDADDIDLLEEIGATAMAAQMAEAEGLDPRSLAEAKCRPEWPRWEEAMEEELRALEAHKTWRLEKPPPNANVVSCRWVFHAKKDASGNVYRYRARLVARGFSQVPGVDFFDTYAPVAKTASIHIALAFAACHDFEVHQVDVKSTYLNGEFEEGEVIYMAIPPGSNMTNDKMLALRLLRPLYGLRQSARHWHKKLLRVLRDKLRMSQSDVDQAVFYCLEGTDIIVIVVHVDDLTIVAATVALIAEVKTKLRKAFDISDEGEVHWILGFAVERDRPNRRLSLSQTAYIKSIVRRFGLEDAKPVSTPMDPHAALSVAQSPSTPAEIGAMRDVPYREAVGSLMYASLGTRPDITYAVSILSRFSDNPGHAHWVAVHRVLRYLNGTKHLKLTYGATSLDLVGYSDADGSMHKDRKAISGYAFLIDGGAVSWSSKRQELISLSTTESEYVAVTHAAKEALWLRLLIGQVFAPFVDPLTLYSDNQSAIALARDNQYHARIKHIDIRFHFIRWVIEDKKLCLVYCPTDDMVADVLTKALPSPKVKHFAAALGLL